MLCEGECWVCLEKLLAWPLGRRVRTTHSFPGEALHFLPGRETFISVSSAHILMATKCVDFIPHQAILWLSRHQLHVRSVTQLCPILCNPVDCSPPGSSVHGILQARILEWAAISFSRGSSWPGDGTRVPCVSCTGRGILHHWTLGKPETPTGYPTIQFSPDTVIEPNLGPLVTHSKANLLALGCGEAKSSVYCRHQARGVGNSYSKD